MNKQPVQDNMVCSHPEFYIIHRQSLDYILEFCAYYECRYVKKIEGDWKSLFPNSRSD